MPSPTGPWSAAVRWPSEFPCEHRPQMPIPVPSAGLRPADQRLRSGHPAAQSTPRDRCARGSPAFGRRLPHQDRAQRRATPARDHRSETHSTSGDRPSRPPSPPTSATTTVRRPSHGKLFMPCSAVPRAPAAARAPRSRDASSFITCGLNRASANRSTSSVALSGMDRVVVHRAGQHLRRSVTSPAAPLPAQSVSSRLHRRVTRDDRLARFAAQVADLGQPRSAASASELRCRRVICGRRVANRLWLRLAPMPSRTR